MSGSASQVNQLSISQINQSIKQPKRDVINRLWDEISEKVFSPQLCHYSALLGFFLWVRPLPASHCGFRHTRHRGGLFGLFSIVSLLHLLSLCSAHVLVNKSVAARSTATRAIGTAARLHPPINILSRSPSPNPLGIATWSLLPR